LVQKEPPKRPFKGVKILRKYIFSDSFLPLINTPLWKNVKPPGVIREYLV